MAKHALETAALLAFLLTVTACGTETGSGGGATSPPAQVVTQEEASTTANEIIGLFADDSASKAKFISDSKTFDEMSGSNEECGRAAPPPGDPPNPGDGCQSEPFDAEAAAKDIKEWFSDHLFKKELTDAKLTTDKMVVYCFDPKDMCGDDDEAGGGVTGSGGRKGGSDGRGGSDGKKDEVDDAKCLDAFAKVPVCVAVSKIGDKNLAGKVLVGYSPQVIPATFTMTPDKLTGDVDLAKALEAFKLINTAMGEDLPDEVPTAVAGVIGAELLRGADKKLTGTLHIKQAVHVGAFDKTDKRFYDVQVAQAMAAVKVVLGQADNTVVIAAALNAVEVGVAADLLFGNNGDVTCSSGGKRAPGEPIMPDDCGEPKDTTPKEGAFFAKLAGASYQVALSVDSDKSMDSISITGLGLGNATSTIKYFDGKAMQDVAALDLNKDATPPRKLDLSMTYDGDKMVLQVVPQLDAMLVHTMAAVAKIFGEDMPKFLHKGTSQVTLDGSAKPGLEFRPDEGSESPTPITPPDPGGGKGVPPDEEEMDDGGFPWIKVLDGLLTLKATGMDGIADALVQVKTDQCVVESEVKPKEGEETHFFSRVAAGTCKAPAGK